jgi:uncharacterized protein (TIGR02996 family)
VRRTDFEDAIFAEPDNLTRYLIYSDWLQAHGDPLGELIVVQHQRETRPDDAALAAREAELLRALALPPGLERVGMTWRLGFMREIAANLTLGQTTLRDVIDLLGHPAARLVDSLSVLLPAGRDVEALCDRPIGRLTRLVLCADEGVLDMRELLRRNRELVELTLHAPAVILGQIDLPQVAKLVVQLSLPPEEIAALATQELPRLEHLCIALGGWNPRTIAPLLDGRGKPALRKLFFTHVECAYGLCEQLAAAPILPRLTHLGISDSDLDHEGAQLLIDRREAFAHLEYLCLSRNLLKYFDEDALAPLAREVDLEFQRRP